MSNSQDLQLKCNPWPRAEPYDTMDIMALNFVLKTNLQPIGFLLEGRDARIHEWLASKAWSLVAMESR